MNPKMPRPRPVSRQCGKPAPAFADQELIERCRNAPVAVLRAIDCWREQRGMPRLWPDIERVRARRAARAGRATTVARLKMFLAERGLR
jgi:hypothetical protein